MKNKLIPILLVSIFSVTNINAVDVEKLIEKIKDIRKSTIAKEEIEKVDSPIIAVVDKNKTLEKNITKATNINKESFNLKAIIDNKAFINDKWYNKGDKIGSYTIVDIMSDSIYLKNRRKEKIISFNKENSKYIKIIGR